MEGFVNVNGPEEEENKSNGISMLGVAFLFTSFSGDVASDERPDRNNELSVTLPLPLDGDGDDCCPFGCALFWNGFRTGAVSVIVFCTLLILKSKSNF